MTKSRTLRKAGAVVLSLAMAFSVAGVAPSADAAAKTPALSAKKGTIKVGKKKTVKVKNTKAKKVKKLVVSSSNKKVATVKKKSKVKFTVTGKKAGTAKITAKVTLKKKVAGKKVYILKYTATVKKAATTPTEAPVVAVTGVTLSNSTPKVGDTISASVTPSNATNVTYQWLADDAVIAGATSATYTVAETDLGKQLSVTVQGDNNSTATSQKTAKVEAKAAADFAVSAKQTHAKVIEVTYTTGAPSADSKYVVTKGAQTVAVTAGTAKENVVTLTASENLTDGDYKVTVTTSANKTAEATFTGQKPVLTEVKFTNNNLSVSANTTDGLKKGYAHIDSTDQFGDHMNLTSPTFTCSKGDVSFKADTGILTCDATGTTDGTYKLGEMVVISVMYDNNTKVVPATLTVTTAAMAKTITFGDLTSDDTKAYPVDKITQSNLARGVYWFPVTEAADDAGIPLDTERLNQMVEAGTVFITPKDEKGTIIYADQFSEKTVDGKKVPAIIIKGGSELSGLNAGVDMQLSVFSIGGAQSALPVKIQRDAVVKDLVLDIPELYVGKTSEIKMSATDTDGNNVDLYKVTNNFSLAKPEDAYNASTGTTNVKTAALRLFDTAQGRNAIGTKITMSTGINCDWELVRSATDHSVYLKVTPKAGQDDSTLNITGTTAAFTAVTYANIKINKSRTIDGVSGFGVGTKYLNTNTDKPGVISGANTNFTLSDGSTIKGNTTDYVLNYVQDGKGVLKNAAATVANLQLKNGNDANEGAQLTPALVDGAGTVYLYTMEITGVTPSTAGVYDGNAFKLNSNPAATAAALASKSTGGSASLVVKESAKTGQSDTVKISLYKLTKVKDKAEIKVEQLGTKSVTFTAENEDTASYKITFDAKDNVLYAGVNNNRNGDVLPITITTEGGAAVDQSKLKSVKIVNKNNDGATFDYYNGKVFCTHESKADAKTLNKATINATVENAGDTVDVSAEFTYKTEQPVVTYTGLSGSAVTPGNKVTVSGNTIGDVPANTTIKYQDQYYTEASADGIYVEATVVNNKTSVANLSATYDGGVVSLWGTGNISSGEAFQVVINGGIGLTMYCTAGGDIALTAEPAYTADLSITSLGTATTADCSGTVDAPEDGAVYVLSAAQYADWDNAGSLKSRSAGPAVSNYAAKATVSAGVGVNWTATAAATNMKADDVYYAVYQSDTDMTITAFEKGRAVAATAKTISGTSTVQLTKTGNATTVFTGIVIKDQFGNAMTAADDDGLAAPASETTLVNTGVKYTKIGWDDSGVLTVSATSTQTITNSQTDSLTVLSGNALTVTSNGSGDVTVSVGA